MDGHYRLLECPFCGHKFLDRCDGKAECILMSLKVKAYRTSCPECKKEMYASNTAEKGIDAHSISMSGVKPTGVILK